jgi:hypothetical protein
VPGHRRDRGRRRPESATLTAVTAPSPARKSVFLSYANADRARVEPLVTALEGEGLDVWWDREIPRGQNFNRVIEAALDEARCAIVIWSQSSVTSEWVFNEASESRKRQILVPVLIDEVEPPLEFRHLQAARLVEWRGDRSDREWSGLLSAVRALVKQPSHASPSVASKEASRVASGVASGEGSGVASSVAGSVANAAAPPRPSRVWWHTPAGAAAGAGALLLGAALLLMALNQIGLFGGATAPAESSAGAAAVPAGAPTVSSLGVPPDAAPQNTPAVQPTAAEATPDPSATSTERVNLLDPAQGGKLVIANQDEWRLVVGTRPTSATLAAGGFAVFAFRNEKPAVIDGLGVFVEYTNDVNVKELALSASDQSENGPFRKVGTVTVPNYRNMRGPVHEFPLQPFSARYVKVEILQWQNAPGYPNGYLGNLQLLGKPQ